MTLRILALFTCLLSFVVADTVPNVPVCGSITCLFPSAERTNCGWDEPQCMCTKPAWLDTIRNCLPAKCTEPEDIDAYNNFLNLYCKGETGYPLDIRDGGDSTPAAHGGNMQPDHSSGSASGSAAASEASATQAVGGAQESGSAAPVAAEGEGVAGRVGVAMGVGTFGLLAGSAAAWMF
ncbi:hypothetical protein K402DRAFT_424995 [Aulographum hederae CBS 113979]|uniref:CFEM domain-containing protein n=1 Tax=Aulographum hederae CBS 113979 TaxID=1176131 RepID=A0A6G1GM84_9PEZI|nr:hypothetical protein K402DRAFT_424995 [Aulographum hederae CBS 113979]